MMKRYIWAVGISLRLICTMTSAYAQLSENSQPAPWSYEGSTGPEHWGSLDPEYAACSKGKQQSPIDLGSSISKASPSQGAVEIQYQPTMVTLMNNGHTLQLNDPTHSNTIKAGHELYTLTQLHFHAPSEHTFRGKGFEMEGHLVHQSDEGKLAVIGFWIQQGPENELFREMWSKLPKEPTLEDIKLDQPLHLEKLLPQDPTLYMYKGSLTTPPCTEGINWSFIRQPITMSSQQIAAFKSIFPNNNRPIQPVNKRAVRLGTWSQLKPSLMESNRQ
jgi:carbonic anhydrase